MVRYLLTFGTTLTLTAINNKVHVILMDGSAANGEDKIISNILSNIIGNNGKGIIRKEGSIIRKEAAYSEKRAA